MACPSCLPIRPIQVRGYRVIGFAAKLTSQAHLVQGVHYVITSTKYDRRRFGRAYVVCACEAPGIGYVGAGVVVVWGRNGKAMTAAIAEAEITVPTVIVALYPGTKAKGGEIAKIPALLPPGTTVVYTRIEDGDILRVDHPGRVSYLRGIPWRIE